MRTAAIPVSVPLCISPGSVGQILSGEVIDFRHHLRPRIADWLSQRAPDATKWRQKPEPTNDVIISFSWPRPPPLELEAR